VDEDDTAAALAIEHNVRILTMNTGKVPGCRPITPRGRVV
jgi:hypothetical protein